MGVRHNPLHRALAYLKRGERINQEWSEENPRSREWEDLYRNRWQHDKVVRSTHGVNCTGSCSWKIHVKDGIITWETQQTDYPSLGPDVPEYEPRGCPRGASFSWYTYSPLRVKYPYVRGELMALWREALSQTHDPVAAWQWIVGDPTRRRRYQKARGKGGFVRASWEEVSTIIAASNVATIKDYGPDRIFGFSPIPAMSMVSYAAGSRYLSLIGASVVSFYDWYADLPPASPQVWGEQTDVPESADWYNASYMIIWGTNLPMTRTPDAHFMVEARYNGTKVVGVSPDYAEYIKFADLWLAARPGTDAALAMAMTHVILKEFYVEQPDPYFLEYAKTYTDLPLLVTLQSFEEGWRADRFLHASDLVEQEVQGDWKTVAWDDSRREPYVPNGSIGFRWDGSGRWNLKGHAKGKECSPSLSLLPSCDEILSVQFPYFGDGHGRTISRPVPVKQIANADGTHAWVATVYDLLLAHMGVAQGVPGETTSTYDDDAWAYTPAWQEKITGVKKSQAILVAREFAENASRTHGRSMIAMGAGTNHWYHSDLIYRTLLNLVLLTGSQGVNGGGWAHYVGQEKVRPLEGWSTIAFASDWTRPPRQQNGTSFFYFVTDQFRYEELDTADMGAPWARSQSQMHPADMNALAARLGWMPSYPQFQQNPLTLVKEARDAGARSAQQIIAHVVQKIRSGQISWAIEDPDHPDNFPRVLFIWRSNLLGASGKGHEYFLKHLLGAEGHVLAEENHTYRPQNVRVPEEAPQGKLDLVVDIDFRMTSSGLYSDIVLPAATWYEKHDISSTDMHPFVHPFNPAIAPPWETRTDWDTFKIIARRFAELAAEHLPEAEDLVAVPLSHDTPDELAQPSGKVRDWRAGEVEAIPGKTMPKLIVVDRRFAEVYDRMVSLGPLAEASMTTKGITVDGHEATEQVRQLVGTIRTGSSAGRPDLTQAEQAANAILTLSGATNGRHAVREWKALEKSTGLSLAEIAEKREEDVYTMHDLTVQPRLAIASPVWSGLESQGRRYSPFTANVDYGIPWRTLTGRQQFYLDHEWMLDFGEGFPTFRPPLGLSPFHATDVAIDAEGPSVMVQYLTPHQKWGIHSTYSDNLRMLTLSRGGQTIWISQEDAKTLAIADNDWIEAYNRNGVVVARAIVSHRIPHGVVLMYHAQDRTIGVPGSPITNDRAGTHNSLTRIIPKPTHMIGGYAQFSYGFNYYGPTGHQRDAVTMIRPLNMAKGVQWLES